MAAAALTQRMPDPAARDETLRALAHGQAVDVLVVGGGITGAGVLREAALRGVSALLVEQGDFASGTSSRSSKLIHGGARYLMQHQLGLVREVSRERAVLAHIAPHLVRETAVIIPLYENAGMRPMTARFGLWLFDQLAGTPRSQRHRSLTPAQVLTRCPGLNRDGLLGGLEYREYVTNDARLVVETVQTARAAGAAALNHVRVEGFTHGANGRVNGAVLTDLLTGTRLCAHARSVVNATGPWVDAIRRLDDPGCARRLHLTKGVHLVFDRRRIPQDATLILPARDSRLLFAIPRADKVYIGTTDTDYDGPLDAHRTEQADIDYLLDAARRWFPDAGLTSGDILGVWSGIRPLLHQPGKAPSEISRRDEVFVSQSGLISVAGGKLTGFRTMAQRVFAHAAQAAGLPSPCAQPLRASREAPLLGGFAFDRAQALATCRRHGVPDSVAVRWLDVYGASWRSLSAVFERSAEMRRTLDGRSGLTAAEVTYFVEAEQALTLADVLCHRTDYFLFAADHGLAVAPCVADVMGPALGWDAARRDEEVRNYRARVEHAQAAVQPGPFAAGPGAR